MRSKQTICNYRKTIETNSKAQIWQIQSLLERWTFTLALIHGRPPRALLGARIRGSAGLSWLPKPQVAREYKNQIQIHKLRNTLREECNLLQIQTQSETEIQQEIINGYRGLLWLLQPKFVAYLFLIKWSGWEKCKSFDISINIFCYSSRFLIIFHPKSDRKVETAALDLLEYVWIYAWVDLCPCTTWWPQKNMLFSIYYTFLLLKS